MSITAIMGLSGIGGGKVSTQEFTSSGIWTVPNGVKLCQVLLVGGGGGGGAGHVSLQYAGGGGGGGEIVFGVVFLGTETSVTVTIGDGGSGGTGGLDGSNGGASSFGSFLTADFGNFGQGGGSVEPDCRGGIGGGNTSIKSNYNEYSGVDNSMSTYGNTQPQTGSVVGARHHGGIISHPMLVRHGGGAGGNGQASTPGLLYRAPGNTLFGNGGSKSSGTDTPGGGASYGPGGNAQTTGNGLSPASGYGGGGGAGYPLYNGGDGAPGYCLVMWNE